MGSPQGVFGSPCWFAGGRGSVLVSAVTGLQSLSVFLSAHIVRAVLPITSSLRRRHILAVTMGRRRASNINEKMYSMVK